MNWFVKQLPYFKLENLPIGDFPFGEEGLKIGLFVSVAIKFLIDCVEFCKVAFFNNHILSGILIIYRGLRYLTIVENFARGDLFFGVQELNEFGVFASIKLKFIIDCLVFCIVALLFFIKGEKK